MAKIQILTLTEKRIYLPLVLGSVPAGFPSPAAEYEDTDIDINDIVISNPTSTFYMRVKGNSMADAYILDGDILVVDKSIEPTHGKIVIAVVDGEFTVKTLYHKDGIIKLVPANPAYPEIELKSEQELNIWGVVSYTIHLRTGHNSDYGNIHCS